jgi:hypothetical protein
MIKLGQNVWLQNFDNIMHYIDAIKIQESVPSVFHSILEQHSQLVPLNFGV